MRRLLLRALPLAAGLLLLLLLLALGLYAPLFDRWAPQQIDRPAAGPRAEAVRRVLLISVDGLSPRVLARTRAPVLEALAREGAAAVGALTVMPSVTLTAHATMLSGLAPDAHRVTWNRYQPWSRVAVPSLYSRCRDAGLRCALFAGKRKFVHFAEQEPGVERYRYRPDAAGVLEAAARWLADRDGDFALIHLAEVDLAGHEAGWGSREQRAAIAGVDRLLGAFLARIRAASERRTSMLLTSDHGGHGTRHGTDRPEDLEIPWLLWGDGVPASVRLAAPVGALDTAPTLGALLGLPPNPAWPGRARFPLPQAARGAGVAGP